MHNQHLIHPLLLHTSPHCAIHTIVAILIRCLFNPNYFGEISWNFRNGCRHFHFWSLLWLESQFFWLIFGLKLLPLLIQSQFLLTSTNYATFPYFSPSPSNLHFLVISFLMSSSRQSVGRPEFHVPVAGQGLPPAQTLRLRLLVKAAVDRPCEETWQEPAGWCPSSLATLKKPWEN